MDAADPELLYGSATSFFMLGAAYAQTGRFEEAVSPYKKALLRGRGSEFSDIAAHLGLASTYIALGREKEARAEAAEVLRINPRFTIKGYVKTFPVIDQSREEPVLVLGTFTTGAVTTK